MNRCDHPSVTAQFNQEDEAERNALRWIQGFHGPSSIHRLLCLYRGQSVEGKVVLMLTRSQAKRRVARPEWSLISYLVDENHVRFWTYPTRADSRAAFEAASAGVTPLSVRPPALRTST